MLTRFRFESNGIVESASEESDVCVFQSPDDLDKSMLRAEFGLDEYDLASSVDDDEIPRLEVSGDRVFMVWKVPERTQVGTLVDLGVQTLAVAMKKGRIAFISSKGGISFDSREFRGVSNVSGLLLGFLLHGIRHFVGHLRAIRMMSDDIEKQVTISMGNRYLLQMFNLSESLIYYIDAIEGNNAVLVKMRSMAFSLGLGAEHMPALDDIVLEGNQASRQADIYSSVLSGLMDARGTIVNNNMNVLLKNLTLINIIFLPLNLIASIGGMSEWSMMTRGMDWRLSYGLFVVGMVGVGWLTWNVVRHVIDKSGAEKPRLRRTRRRL